MNEVTLAGTTTKNRGLVVVAFALMLLHNLDEAFWHKEGDGKVAFFGVLVIAIAVIASYPRLSRVVRAVVLGLLGALAMVAAGGGHIAHFFTGHVEPIAYSGIAFFAGGLLLAYVAVVNATNR